jgi:tetratricopeptide (TPR) repeat protein
VARYLDTATEAVAAAFFGNAYRAAGSLKDAGRQFDTALQLLLACSERSAWIDATVGSLFGSYLKDRRLLAEAKATLSRARLSFELAADSQGVAKVDLKLAVVEKHEGSIASAIDLTRRALPKVRSFRQAIWALHNLADFSCAAGRVDDAEKLLDFIQPLYSVIDENGPRLRMLWLEAQIALAKGRTETAESRFKEVISGFVRQGQVLIAAVAGVDLASMYLQIGRLGAVKRLASSLQSVLQRAGVEREALAAACLLANAAGAQAVTVELLSEVRKAFEVDPRSAADLR